MKRFVLSMLTMTMTIYGSLFGAGYGGQASTNGSDKQKVNYFGTVITTTKDKPIEVENISISGAYKNIPFYQKPTDPTKNPANDTEFIDLAKVYQIKRNPEQIAASLKAIADTVEQQEEKKKARKKRTYDLSRAVEGIYRFNNREYIEVSIVFNDAEKTEETFIIDMNKEIFCTKVHSQSRKEISFEALRILTIEGHKEREEECTKTITVVSRDELNTMNKEELVTLVNRLQNKSSFN